MWAVYVCVVGGGKAYDNGSGNCGSGRKSRILALFRILRGIDEGPGCRHLWVGCVNERKEGGGVGRGAMMLLISLWRIRRRRMTCGMARGNGKPMILEFRTAGMRKVCPAPVGWKFSCQISGCGRRKTKQMKRKKQITRQRTILLRWVRFFTRSNAKTFSFELDVSEWRRLSRAVSSPSSSSLLV